MGWRLRKCEKCNRYTLKTDKCPYCDGQVHIPHPAKFSPDDKYAKQRVALKMESAPNENNNKRKTTD